MSEKYSDVFHRSGSGHEAADISNEILGDNGHGSGDTAAARPDMRLSKERNKAMGAAVAGLAGVTLMGVVLAGSKANNEAAANQAAAESQAIVETQAADETDQGASGEQDDAAEPEADIDAGKTVEETVETAVERSEEDEIVSQFLHYGEKDDEPGFRKGAHGVESDEVGEYLSYGNYDNYFAEGGWGDKDKQERGDHYGEADMKEKLYDLFGVTHESEASDEQIKLALFAIDSEQALSAGQTAVDADIPGFEGLSPDEAAARVEAIREGKADMTKAEFDRQLALFYAEADLIREDMGHHDLTNMGIAQGEDGSFHATKSTIEDAREGTTVYTLRRGVAHDDGSVTVYTSMRKTPCANHMGEIIEQKIDETVVDESPQLTPEDPTPTPEPELDPEPDPEPTPTPTPEPEHKTPLDEEVVEQGGTGNIEQRDQELPVTDIDEEAPFESDPADYIEEDDGSSSQIGSDPSSADTAAIEAADDSFAQDRISEETPDYSAGEASQAGAEQAFTDSGSEQVVQEVLDQVEQSGGQTQTGENGGPTQQQEDLASQFDELFGKPTDTSETAEP